MNILVINAGSSSIKYQLFDMKDLSVLASGLLERIGESEAKLKHTSTRHSEPVLIAKQIADHSAGLTEIVSLLTDSEQGVIRSPAEVSAIGHRVVHGGESFQNPTRIDEAVLRAIEENIPLAPLHNPPNLTGIRAAMKAFPSVAQVAVFDTAFHQTIPRHAYHYAIPDEYYKQLKIRRYGFHGTSHRYVARKAAAMLGKPDANLITVHLGNGCSITAVRAGRSIDTSMGMTPLEGLIMGTRSGDIDPAIHMFLSEQSGLSLKAIDQLLNKESGLKGLTGTNDMRDILKMRAEGDRNADLAIAMYGYRIKKYIGAYYAALGRVDAIVFTAGIGENSPEIRAQSVSDLDALGIKLDASRNSAPDRSARAIHADGSSVSILVIPTNEELEIAMQTMDVAKPGA